MAIINCGKCKGMKKMIGMGMLHEQCSVCKGLGFIDDKPKELKDAFVTAVAINPVSKTEVEVKVKKKPGRKPKLV